MSIFSRLANQVIRKDKPAKKEGPNPFYPADLAYTNGAFSSSTSVAAIICALNLLTGSMCQAKFKLYRKIEDRVVPVEKHRLLEYLKSPSSIMGNKLNTYEYIYRRYFAKGNAYFRLYTNAVNHAVDGIPAECARTFLVKTGRGIERRYDLTFPQLNGIPDEQNVPASSVLAFHNYGFNGEYSPSPIAQAANLKQTLSAASYYNKAVLKGGMYSKTAIVDTGTQPYETRKRIYDDVRDKLSGAENAHKVPVIPQGFTLQQLGISSVDMQVVELMRFSIEEIGRIWQIPPRLLLLYQGSTRVENKLDSLAAEFVKYSIRPHGIRFSAEINEKLLTNTEKANGFYIDLDYGELTKGSLAELAMIGDLLVPKSGVLTPNEWRKELGYDSIEGGDKLILPAGSGGQSGSEEEPEPPAQEDEDEDNSNLIPFSRRLK